METEVANNAPSYTLIPENLKIHHYNGNNIYGLMLRLLRCHNNNKNILLMLSEVATRCIINLR